MKKSLLMKVLALTLAVSPLFASAAMLTRQLQLGMSGADVSSLQAFLAQDPTIYPQGLVTGYFGSLTRAAVIKFQARNGISTVGRVGPQTLAFINSLMGGTTSSTNVRVIGQVGLTAANNQVTMSWNTAVGTTATVYYSTSPLTLTEATDFTPFTISGGNSVVLNSDLRTSHSGTITGLNSNSTYYYVIYARDAQGNESITLPSTFQTSI